MLVRTDPLGGSPLSRAARAGELPQWYPAVPRGAAAWTAHARAVTESVSPRWHDELSSAFAARGEAARRLERSAGGKGIVVTTGQQPGLFGGPLMTLVKALTARALADVLEEVIGRPVAPVFWAATDDADFDEATVVSVALEGGARTLKLDRRPPVGTPVARAAIGPEIERLAPVLLEACGSAPHRSYVDRALAAYQAGAPIGGAYVTLLRDVLEPLGIAVLDVSDPGVARAAAPVLRRAAVEARGVALELAERSREIVAAGFRPQVDEVHGLSLVFLNEHGVKRRLMLPEATALAERELAGDSFLSSTVLLRPVIERAMLPTVAYLGGPGEIAYFAQVSAVADAIGVPKPLVMPRWSTTVIEPRIARMLDDLGVTADALAEVHAVEARLARERLTPGAERALRALHDDVTADVGRLQAASDGLVPASVLDGLRRSLEHRVERLERRLLAAVKRRETEMMRKVATAHGALYPGGIRQERALAFIPLLARYGPALIDEMLEAARGHARALITGAATISAAPGAPPAARV